MTHTEQPAPVIYDFTSCGNIRKEKGNKFSIVSPELSATGKDSAIAIDRDHTKTVKGKDGKEHVVYRATIYKDTTLKEYKNGFVNGKQNSGDTIPN